MSSLYSMGKKNGTGTSHSQGKSTRSTFSKVTASAGKGSGTARGGDKSG